MKEMPLAQKRGSFSAPGICLANSGAKLPCTVEVWQPTFSNTRPAISAITPPPPSPPSFSVRVQGVFTKRPGALPSAAGQAVGLILDRLERGADLIAQMLEPEPGTLLPRRAEGLRRN